MYRDRYEAGNRLAEKMAQRSLASPALLAVPRGGVFIAQPVARRLNLPLDLLITRKLGHPHNPEVAIGAVMPDGSAILDEAFIQSGKVSEEWLHEAIRRETAEIRRRRALYGAGESIMNMQDKTAIIIDDGIATGYTLQAAVRWLRSQNPRQIIVAAPVGPPDVVAALRELADEVICPLQPEPFWAVGAYYAQFPQNTDEEVIAALQDINQAVGKHKAAFDL